MILIFFQLLQKFFYVCILLLECIWPGDPQHIFPVLPTTPIAIPKIAKRVLEL